jgi:Ca2+-binding EF-hand superfamily protein
LIYPSNFRKDSAADFISTLDKDGDGKITFLELLKELFPMTPSKQLNDVYRRFYPEAVTKPMK